MDLHSQDVVIVLKLLASGFQPWTYAKLGEELAMSASQVFTSIVRADKARLLDAAVTHPPIGRKERAMLPEPNHSNLKEFLIHGVKYAFPVERGGTTRGIPTAESAPPLKKYFVDGSARGLDSSQIYREHFPEAFPPPSVWPYAEGTVRGIEFSPLYKNVPVAASRDPKLYELLALVDVIREGRAREREIAIRELTARIDLA